MLFGRRHHPAVGSGCTEGWAGGGTLCGEGFRAPDEDGGSGDPPVTASPSPLNNHTEKISHHFAAALPQGTAALALSAAPGVHRSPGPKGLRAGGYLWWASGCWQPASEGTDRLIRCHRAHQQPVGDEGCQAAISRCAGAAL